MTLAHVSVVPFEELLSLASAAGAFLLTLRAPVHGRRGRQRGRTT